eukprot:GHUV01016472.1.p1 GENE.GHUV01016472.1~~GHUV01016472.1.p1  ORF type:complete len:124 (+),score=19.21 GHUV01016472.1:1095-1466(+)
MDMQMGGGMMGGANKRQFMGQQGGGYGGGKGGGMGMGGMGNMGMGMMPGMMGMMPGMVSCDAVEPLSSSAELSQSCGWSRWPSKCYVVGFLCAVTVCVQVEALDWQVTACVLFASHLGPWWGL